MTAKQEKPNIPNQIRMSPASQGVLVFKQDLSSRTKDDLVFRLAAGQFTGWGYFDKHDDYPSAQISLSTTPRKQNIVDKKAMTQSGFIFWMGRSHHRKPTHASNLLTDSTIILGE